MKNIISNLKIYAFFGLAGGIFSVLFGSVMDTLASVNISVQSVGQNFIVGFAALFVLTLVVGILPIKKRKPKVSTETLDEKLAVIGLVINGDGLNYQSKEYTWKDMDYLRIESKWDQTKLGAQAVAYLTFDAPDRIEENMSNDLVINGIKGGDKIFEVPLGANFIVRDIKEMKARIEKSGVKVSLSANSLGRIN